jgi:hypothetical protein
LEFSSTFRLRFFKKPDGPLHSLVVLHPQPASQQLGFGSAFNLRLAKKQEWFCFFFIAASYLVMCNINYGMNLRYANMWDLPLRVLAFSQLLVLIGFVAQRWRRIALFAAVGLTCALEMRNYVVMAVEYPLYELVSPELMRGLKILKSPADLK